MDETVKKMELLAPAGNYEKLETAFLYGADAVYCAGKRFGMRSFAGNLSPAELCSGVKMAHEKGKKVYVTLNIAPRNTDVMYLPAALENLAQAGADGVIVSDLGVLAEAKKRCPQVPVHISTQANVTNYLSARQYYELGAKRVILARELSLEEIAGIRAKTPKDLELECFVHGSMCVSYSGRCLLSNYMTGRSGNLGECAQPCRYHYALVEDRTPGHAFPIEEDENGSYILNSMDLMMLPHLKELQEAGVDSLKIEGRMKTTYYVATVVRAYRKALDDLAAGKPFDPALVDVVLQASHRPYGTGFFFGRQPFQDYDKIMDRGSRQFAGVVLERNAETGEIVIEQRNRFYKGDDLLFITPDGREIPWDGSGMTNDDGEAIDDAKHPVMRIHMTPDADIPPLSMLSKGE